VWFAREVWPSIRASVPAARLAIVGAQPTRAVRALADAGRGIEVTGTVPDVRPYLWAGAVSVAPLHTARGVQTKVLEAVAAGLPAVVTPAVLEGVPAEVAPACLVAGDAGTFALQVVSLLKATPAQRQAQAGRAALSSLRWEERLKDLPGLLEEAAQARP
jgi:glycosyltransferase involved in cell wall biosynthesis